MRTTVSKALQQLRLILVSEDYRQFTLLFVLMLFTALLQVTGVASILPFMQLVAKPGVVAENAWLSRIYEGFGFSSERQMLVWSGIVVFCLFTLSVIATALTSWLIQRSIWATAHRMAVRQLKVYMQLPYEFFLINSSAELLRRVVADVNRVLSDVLMAGSQLLAQSTLAIGMFLLLLYVNPSLSMIALLGFGVVYALLHWMRHAYLVRLGQSRVDTDNLRYTSFIDAIAGMKAIRVANASRYFSSKFAEASDQYARIYPKLDLATRLPRYVMEILAFGGILTVVLIAVGTQEDFASAVPILSVFALATYRLLPALHSIFENAARLSNAFAVIESVSADLRTDRPLEPELLMMPDPLDFQREIRLREITFRYETANTDALRGIDLAINKGEMIAFVGATGSGKTTLVDLLVGLLLPTTGALEIDGTPVTSDTVARWRQLLAYVPQDVFLYDDTIARNITFGAPEQATDDERIRDVTRMSQLHEFVTSELSDGYDTVVGEHGVRLSGGQRQRLGIARAVFRQPEVMLLDEATSALDTVTEEAVMQALRKYLPDVTIIMVAHRLSTVRFCDRIFLVEGGQVIAEGSYDSLYRSNPVFQRMVDAMRKSA